MSAQTLTCNCRYCGYIICYSSDNIGVDARCPRCGQEIRLPGRLEKVATIGIMRQKEPTGLALEILGFACMFFLFPFGLILGVAMVYFGWRKSNRFVCSSCSAIVQNRSLESCPKCKTKFGIE